ncbi:MAG TPA: hypothetical protein VH307_30745, partial [Streptosporangiaceae bacterium]|nr:hypothetical protein [Streptosporangiaceae bacterium]
MAGVTERPFQLGDPIYKFVPTATGAQEIEWHITEHDRPHHAKLQAEDGLIGVVVVALRYRQEVAMLHRQLRSVPVHVSPRLAGGVQRHGYRCLRLGTPWARWPSG